jgi:hypothetical protein
LSFIWRFALIARFVRVETDLKTFSGEHTRLLRWLSEDVAFPDVRELTEDCPEGMRYSDFILRSPYLTNFYGIWYVFESGELQDGSVVTFALRFCRSWILCILACLEVLVN